MGFQSKRRADTLSIADSICAVIIGIRNVEDIDNESSRNLEDAATALYFQCVKEINVGWWVIGLGYNEKLAIAMSEYPRTVTCRTNPRMPAPDTANRQWVLQRLPFGTQPINFGRRGLSQAGTFYGLPATFNHPDRKCTAYVSFLHQDPGDRTVSKTWAAVFDAAVAIVAKCVPQGQIGIVNVAHGETMSC